MVDGCPLFLDDLTKIAANPPTPWATLFPILIKAKNTAFLAPFTSIAGEGGNWGKLGPFLAAISVSLEAPRKWRRCAHDFCSIISRLVDRDTDKGNNPLRLHGV